MARQRTLVEILDDHERGLKRLNAALARVGGAAVGINGEMVIYEVSGTFEKANYPGLKAIRVRLQAGGGGAGGAAATGAGQYSVSAAGAGGGYSEKLILVEDLADVETVTVGTGGAGGAPGSGASGGASSFGSHMNANGGGGGGGGGATTAAIFSLGPNAGALPTGGDINIRGGYPAPAFSGYTGTAAFGIPMNGGDSMMGHGGKSNSQGTGSAGVGFGSGGGATRNGQNQAARTGGAGADGIVIVELLYSLGHGNVGPVILPVPTAWIDLSFENSWANYGSGYNDGQYRRRGDGTVELRGLIRNGSALNTVAATLPSGFRPPGGGIHNQFSNGGHTRIDVKSNGEILITNQGTGNPLSWVSLEGIFFDTVGGG